MKGDIELITIVNFQDGWFLPLQDGWLLPLPPDLRQKPRALQSADGSDGSDMDAILLPPQTLTQQWAAAASEKKR